MCKKDNKKYICFDRKFDSFIYAIMLIISLFIIIFPNITKHMQGAYLTIYYVLNIINIITMLICVGFAVTRHSVLEGIVLSFALTTIVILFIEQIIVFLFTYSLSFNSFGYLINYVDITLFKMIFIIHRLCKIRTDLNNHNEYKRIKKEYDEGVIKNNG